LSLPRDRLQWSSVNVDMSVSLTNLSWERKIAYTESAW
jgi:hypothetical protein